MAKNNGSIEMVWALLMNHNTLNGGWHSTEAIKAVGGPHALRRVRELRAQGVIISARRVQGSRQWEYRA